MIPKRIILTGASDGIGAEAARQLHNLGHHVVVVGRSPEKTRSIAAELSAPFYVADFQNLADVRHLALQLGRDFPRIDVLANNAGAMFSHRELTRDGHERTMQVNHLAPFLLTTLLLDVLVASHATIINTSSIAHRLFSKFNVEDLDLSDKYTLRSAYGNSKLENILFTRELHRRYHDVGVSSAAFHPGNVATNLAKDVNGFMRLIYRTDLQKLVLVSPRKGAETLVWLANGTPAEDWPSGEYFIRKQVSRSLDKAASDDVNGRRLWQQSEEWVQPFANSSES